MLLPWPLALRGRFEAMKALLRERGARLALAWVVPTVIAFSLIGGKQAHYLLPLLPGVALLFAVALDRGFDVRIGIASVLLIAAGLVLAFLPRYAATRPDLAFVSDTLAQLREKMDEIEDDPVCNYVVKPDHVIHPETPPLEIVLLLYQGANNVPVVDRDSGRLVGMVSARDLLTALDPEKPK